MKLITINNKINLNKNSNLSLDSQKNHSLINYGTKYYPYILEFYV